MPAATTHVEFARDVYQQLKDPSFVDDSLFYVGSQGPDLLFFSRASGFLPGTIKPLGDLMHDEKVEETIRYIYEYCKKHPILMNYYYGYLCHYMADSTCHPIVFYHAKQIHEETGHSEFEAHVALEACLDTWCLEQHGKQYSDYDVYNYLYITNPQKNELAKMYHALFRDVYHKDVPIYKFTDAIFSIYHITKLLRPSSRQKYDTFYQLETLLKIPRKVTSLMLFDKDSLKERILNKDHKEYQALGQNNKVYTSSFEELYQKGVQEAIDWLNEGGIPKPLSLDFSGTMIHSETLK